VGREVGGAVEVEGEAGAIDRRDAQAGGACGGDVAGVAVGVAEAGGRAREAERERVGAEVVPIRR